MTAVWDYLNAHNAHDAEAVGALYAPDGAHREVATGQSKSGREAIAAGLESFLEAFPDAHWEHGVPVASGARAAVPYRLTGSLWQPLGPFAAAGQALDLEGLVLIEIGVDGITRTTDYWDAATFARQMKAG
jgi:steroid delta-isomerase-like uncharacterized protein